MIPLRVMLFLLFSLHATIASSGSIQMFGKVQIKSASYMEPISLSMTEWEGKLYRSLRYNNIGCLFDLESAPGGTWREVPHLFDGEKVDPKCLEAGGDRLEIYSTDTGGVTISRVGLGLSGSAEPSPDTVAEFCPRYPAPCNIWEASTKRELFERIAEVAENGPQDTAMVVLPDDGLRKPLLGSNWEDCGRPFALSSPLPQDTPFNYESLEFFCKRSVVGVEWKLRVVGTDFGIGYEIRGAQPDMLLESIGADNIGYYDLEEILHFIATMRVGDMATAYLGVRGRMDALKQTIRRVDPGQQAFAALDYDQDRYAGLLVNLFLTGDFITLEDELEAAAEYAVSNPRANAFLNPARNLAPGLTQLMENETYRSVYQTRFGHLITNYAIMRVTMLGSCGEPTKEVRWDTTTWTDYRNGYGHYRGSSAPITQSEFFDLPAGFDAPLEKAISIKLPAEDADVLNGILRQLSCEDPRRGAIEANMLKFFNKDY